MYFQKSPKSHKTSLQNLFLRWDTKVYIPYEDDFTQNVNNFDHYMPFLSINLFKRHTLLT